MRLFTDGACSGNPGPGGWAYILQHPASGQIRDASGAEPHTTNNRMELTGVIEGLASLKRPCRVELVTDSQYVGQGHRRVDAQMEDPGLATQGREAVQAGDERRPLAAGRRAAGHHDVQVTHVLGHHGHPENEACDRMAVAAYKALMDDLPGLSQRMNDLPVV